MKYKVLIAVGLIGLIAAACNSSSQPTNTGSSNDQSQQSSDSGSTTPPTQQTPPDGTIDGQGTPEVIGINITATGFSPANVTIHKGDYVQFTNTDSAPHWPASNPHPIHNGYPGFDALKGLAQGEKYRFQFNKTGAFGYHDHLHPSRGGTITVQ